MTKEAKKELFLKIIENWFDDYTGQINFDNCIGFYHYFLDCLEFELDYCIRPELDYLEFLSAAIGLLSDFPSYEEDKIEDKACAKNAIAANLSISTSKDSIDSFFDSLAVHYYMFRDEYLI